MNNLPFDPGVTGVTFLNETGETIPPHAVMAAQQVGWNEANQAFYLKVAKPTQELIDDSSIWCFNGPVNVATGKTGKAFFALHQPAWCKIAAAVTFATVDVAPPALEVGPVAGQWYVSEDGTGLLTMGAREDESAAGEIESDRVLVLQKPASGSGTVVVGFVIDSFDEYTGVATCTVTFKPCDLATVPGLTEYGKILVSDVLYGCIFSADGVYLTSDELLGRRGAAAWVIDDADPYAECGYQVLGLCCD